MRPAVLFPLFAETRSLPGVGPKLEKLIAKVAGGKLVDLAFDLPVGVIDRSYRPKLREAETGRIATVEVIVRDHLPSRDRRWPYKVRCSDETGFIELVFFHAKGDYLTKLLPIGARRIVSGRIDRFRDGLQMPHPDHVVAPEEADSVPPIEPVYRLTEGLPLKSLAKAVRASLEVVPDLSEWQERNFLKQRRWPSFREAAMTAHAPQRAEDLAPETPARLRLAYDELLANQLALVLIRARL